MIDKKVWLVTGAGRGMGADIARAALAADSAVVATGRDTDAVAKAIGDAEDLLVTRVDITSPGDAQAAVQAALERFGRIDVLVNNAANFYAGYFYAGYFEELTPQQVERQLTTSLLAPMNVTRAVLPVMREQRSGHIMSISSAAGLVGFEFCTAYAASKFGLEAPPTPSRRSMTTPRAPRSSRHGGPPRTASSPATRRGSPGRSYDRQPCALLDGAYDGRIPTQRPRRS